MQLALCGIILKSSFCVLKCIFIYGVCRDVEPVEIHLKDMLQQLNGLIAAKPSEKAVICQGECTPSHQCQSFITLPFLFFVLVIQSVFYLFPEEAEDPACIPIFWISKWVDYSDKYGLGKSLSFPKLGLYFSDSFVPELNKNHHHSLFNSSFYAH